MSSEVIQAHFDLVPLADHLAKRGTSCHFVAFSLSVALLTRQCAQGTAEAVAERFGQGEDKHECELLSVGMCARMRIS